MKTQIPARLSLVLSLVALSVAGCLKKPSASETATLTNSDQIIAMQPVMDAGSPGLDTSDEGDISDAAATPADMPNSVTAPIQLAGALSEMLRLAESGANENVIIAFVTNSPSTFNIGPEEIIYLNDIGISPQAVTAMIIHDRELREATPVSYLTPGSSATIPSFSRADDGTEAYAAPAQPADVTTDDFYGSLGPYGNWVDVSGYGRCWQPTVVSLNPDWRPYCDGGRWVYSDCGWYWLSDYSWGWAPFHYGRWFRHTQLGWCWAPDTVWGPSWVSWRYSNDYCGWAPLPPLAGFRPGFGFTYAGHIVAANFDFGLTPSCFTFVPFRDFCDRHLSHHLVARHQVDGIFHRTVASTRVQIRNHIVINNGLPADRVASATHNDLHPVTVRQFRGTAARGLSLEHLESGGSVLTVQRPSRTLPTQSVRHPSGQQPATSVNNQQLQANAAGTIPASAPQIISRPERYPSATGARANDTRVATALLQSRPLATEVNASGQHQIFIRSYPDSAAPTAPAAEANIQSSRQNPAWLQTGNRFDNRHQQNDQRATLQVPQISPHWVQNSQNEPQALADRRAVARETTPRAGFGNSFAASQVSPPHELNAVQSIPRVNYQPPQYQHQPAETFSPPSQPEPRSNFRSQPAENRAMESRSESRPSFTESRPAPAPAPAVHERASSNEHSAERSQDHQSSGRSR